MGVLSRRRTGMDALFLPPAVYDDAVAAGYDMTHYVRQQPIPMIQDVAPELVRSAVGRPPSVGMNRHQRRAAMKGTGHTWATARALAKRQDDDRKTEADLAARASRMSPVEARKALAEWAARGGDPATPATFEFSEVNDPTKW